jgi:hypothetical protein
MPLLKMFSIESTFYKEKYRILFPQKNELSYVSSNYNAKLEDQQFFGAK